MLVMLWRVLVYCQNLSSRLCFIDKHVKHRSIVPQTSRTPKYILGWRISIFTNYKLYPELLRSRPLKIIHGFLRVGIPDNDLPVGAWSNASVFGKVNGDVTDNNVVQQLNPCIGLIVAGSSSNLQMQRTCSSCTSTTSALLQQHMLLWQNNLRWLHESQSMLNGSHVLFLSTRLFCEGGQHLGLLYA